MTTPSAKDSPDINDARKSGGEAEVRRRESAAPRFVKEDANDALKKGGEAAVERKKQSAVRYNNLPLPKLADITWGADSLQHAVFPELKWVVPRYLTEGVTLLAGKPKIGKSWLALDVGQSVASGVDCLGQQCEPGDVLGLFLKDNKRRLQRRMTTMIGANKRDWPKRLTCSTEWPRLNEGGLNLISEWVKTSANPRLIIVDVLQRVRALPDKSTPQYAADYEALVRLQTLAGDEGL